VWTWLVSQSAAKNMYKGVKNESKQLKPKLILRSHFTLLLLPYALVIAMLVVIIHLVSWLPRFIIYEPLANWRMKGCKGWDQSECRKFSQTATSLLFFSSSAFFIARILLPKDWLFSREGWASLSHSQFIEADLKFYFLLYMARFLSDLISIFFEDRKFVRFFSLYPYNWS
jgi:hypothetical protein